MGVFDYDIKETLAVSARSLVRRAVRKSDGLAVIMKSPAQEPASSEELWHFEFEFRRKHGNLFSFAVLIYNVLRKEVIISPH